MLSIVVEDVEFDVQVCMLRVNGRNVSENKYVKLGAYHTIDLELYRPFTITKPEWDVISLERIEDACNVANKADIAAVVMQEGLANICLLTQNMTIVRQRIERNVPRKRKGSTTQYEKGLEKFFEDILRGIQQNVNFDIVKVLILASPGFVKDQFFRYLNDEAVKRELKPFIENKSKIVLVHSSSGQKHALQEVLSEPAIQSRLADTKYAMEVKTLSRFYTVLGQDSNKAFYGYEHVIRAAESNAVEVLMVTDALFRASDVPTRKKYIALVEKVKACGGNVLVFSSLHPSGEQLTNLTGVAAILHFPMPDIDEEFDH